MKEAAGEANMTVVTIALIAIVLTVGGVIIGRLMKGIEGDAGGNLATKEACENAGMTWSDTDGCK